MICEEVFKLNKDGSLSYNCYCKNPELIENYDKAISDTTQIWECHHKLEEFYSRKELIELGLYYDRPAEELIFLTKKEHRSLHHKGKVVSEESKKKNSEAHKGKTLSEETRKKMSKSKKDEKNTAKREDVRKKLSEAMKGKHWKIVDGKRVYYCGNN